MKNRQKSLKKKVKKYTAMEFTQDCPIKNWILRTVNVKHYNLGIASFLLCCFNRQKTAITPLCCDNMW